MRIRRKRRQQPIHIRLRQRPRRLYEEIGQEGARVQRIIPVDLAGTADPKPVLHDDRPDVDADVEDHDCGKTELGAATLADAFEIEDET